MTFDEVLALARLVLERLGWAGKAISVDAIAAWAPVARKLDPRPEPPAVAMTWLELEPVGGAARRRRSWSASRTGCGSRRCSHEHDPELLDGLGFPDRTQLLLREFADQAPRDEPPVERDLRIETLARLARLDPARGRTRGGAASRSSARASECRVRSLPEAVPQHAPGSRSSACCGT